VLAGDNMIGWRFGANVSKGTNTSSVAVITCVPPKIGRDCANAYVHNEISPPLMKGSAERNNRPAEPIPANCRTHARDVCRRRRDVNIVRSWILPRMS